MYPDALRYLENMVILGFLTLSFCKKKNVILGNPFLGHPVATKTEYSQTPDQNLSLGAGKQKVWYPGNGVTSQFRI